MRNWVQNDYKSIPQSNSCSQNSTSAYINEKRQSKIFHMHKRRTSSFQDLQSDNHSLTIPFTSDQRNHLPTTIGCSFICQIPFMKLTSTKKGNNNDTNHQRKNIHTMWTINHPRSQIVSTTNHPTTRPVLLHPLGSFPQIILQCTILNHRIPPNHP